MPVTAIHLLILFFVSVAMGLSDLFAIQICGLSNLLGLILCSLVSFPD